MMNIITWDVLGILKDSARFLFKSPSELTLCRGILAALRYHLLYGVSPPSDASKCIFGKINHFIDLPHSHTTQLSVFDVLQY